MSKEVQIRVGTPWPSESWDKYFARVQARPDGRWPVHSPMDIQRAIHYWRQYPRLQKEVLEIWEAQEHPAQPAPVVRHGALEVSEAVGRQLQLHALWGIAQDIITAALARRGLDASPVVLSGETCCTLSYHNPQLADEDCVPWPGCLTFPYALEDPRVQWPEAIDPAPIIEAEAILRRLEAKLLAEMGEAPTDVDAHLAPKPGNHDETPGADVLIVSGHFSSASWRGHVWTFASRGANVLTYLCALGRKGHLSASVATLANKADTDARDFRPSKALPHAASDGTPTIGDKGSESLIIRPSRGHYSLNPAILSIQEAGEDSR